MAQIMDWRAAGRFETLCAFNRETHRLAELHIHDALRRGTPRATAQANYRTALVQLAAELDAPAAAQPVAAQARAAGVLRVIERGNSMTTNTDTIPEPPSLADAIRARRGMAPQPDPEPEARACNLHGIEDPPDLAAAIRRRRQKETR
ncbi:MAG TPA: hypothetical protein VFX12_09920 [Vicinamibacterales bacterium]|nr:hypothetical protein [Vicinamibacterales bacterium]